MQTAAEKQLDSAKATARELGAMVREARETGNTSIDWWISNYFNRWASRYPNHDDLWSEYCDVLGV